MLAVIWFSKCVWSISTGYKLALFSCTLLHRKYRNALFVLPQTCRTYAMGLIFENGLSVVNILKVSHNRWHVATISNIDLKMTLTAGLMFQPIRHDQPHVYKFTWSMFFEVALLCQNHEISNTFSHTSTSNSPSPTSSLRW